MSYGHLLHSPETHRGTARTAWKRRLAGWPFGTRCEGAGELAETCAGTATGSRCWCSVLENGAADGFGQGAGPNFGRSSSMAALGQNAEPQA
jgi:hypothetical protein